MTSELIGRKFRASDQCGGLVRSEVGLVEPGPGSGKSLPCSSQSLRIATSVSIQLLTHLRVQTASDVFTPSVQPSISSKIPKREILMLSWTGGKERLRMGVALERSGRGGRGWLQEALVKCQEEGARGGSGERNSAPPSAGGGGATKGKRTEEREESVTMAAANELANFSSESNISTEWNNFAQIETFANPDNSTIRASLASTNWSATSSPASNVSNNTEEPFVILNGKVSHAK